MSDAIIEIVDVSKFYDRGRVAAVRDANLRVEPAEFVALVGPSGCGKSTLLHLVPPSNVPAAARSSSMAKILRIGATATATADSTSASCSNCTTSSRG